MADGRTGLRRVFGDESSFGLLCPNLDRRVGQPWHSSERNQSWTDGDPQVHVGAQGSDEGTSDYFKKMIPMGRLGTADEIASAAVFLASDENG